MTVYRLKSKLFYTHTKGEMKSFNKGKQIGYNNAQRQFQQRMQELEKQNKLLQQQQNQAKGMGAGGVVLGAVGGAAGTIGLGMYQTRKAEMDQQPQVMGDQSQYYQ